MSPYFESIRAGAGAPADSSLLDTVRVAGVELPGNVASMIGQSSIGQRVGHGLGDGAGPRLTRSRRPL